MTIPSQRYTRVYHIPPFPVPKTAEAAEAVGLPWPLGDDPDTTIQWLMREGVERKAAADGLRIIEYRDLGDTPPENINPLADKQLGRPAREFVWRTFEAIGVRDDA